MNLVIFIEIWKDHNGEVRTSQAIAPISELQWCLAVTKRLGYETIAVWKIYLK